MQFTQTNFNTGNVNNTIGGSEPASAGRKRIVRITNELLCEVLCFPAGTKIEGFHTEKAWGQHRPDLDIMVSHPDFTPVAEGHAIPMVAPTYRTVDDKPEFVSWDER